MTNFRIAKCLSNGTIKEFAIFADGTPKAEIKESEEYGKYFKIRNPYSSTLLGKYFYNCIADAVKAVKEGFADAIRVTNQNVPFIGGHIDVCYFLDREIGEQLRAKTINGWKDAKFAFCLTMGNKNSLSGYLKVASDYSRISMFDNPYKYKVFDTPEAAVEFAESLINIARSFVDKLILSNKDENAVNKICDEIAESYGKLSVIEDLFFDLLDNNASKYANEDKSLRSWGYSTEQCVIFDKEFILSKEYENISFFVATQVSHHSGVEVSPKSIEKIFHFIDDNKDSMEKEEVVFNAFKEQHLEIIPVEDMMYVFDRYNKCAV